MHLARLVPDLVKKPCGAAVTKPRADHANFEVDLICGNCGASSCLHVGHVVGHGVGHGIWHGGSSQRGGGGHTPTQLICLVLLLSSCLYFVMVSHTYVFQPWETLDAHMKSLVVIDTKSYTGDGKHVSMLVLCKTLKCKHAPHSRFNNIHITRLGSCADENITSCKCLMFVPRSQICL